MATTNKTVQTDADVADYFAAIQTPARRQDCETLAALMSSVSGQPAKMWGPGIVGFGVHRYKYDSGREGEICAVGFASRKPEIVLYGLDVGEGSKALAKLGKHKTGKGCLYIKTLGDVDLKVLESMIASAARQRMG